MADRTQQLSPTQALERIFEVIRQEAAANPTFARRMLDATGVNVAFTGPEAAAAADPILAAARNEYDQFREMFQSFTEPDLKKMLKNYALATDEQIKGVKTRPKKSGFVDLLWDGSRRKLSERKVR
jgi:hypothetical protein